jgi:ribosome-binding factor A
MVSKMRTQRIADRIHQELSEMMLQNVVDPRLRGISITGVKVDRELSYADVYYSAIEGSQRSPEILAALNHAAGFLRSELARRVELRVFPVLRFHWDPTLEHGDRMERLFAQLKQEGGSPAPQTETPEADG